jgi:hypothetical protein
MNKQDEEEDEMHASPEPDADDEIARVAFEIWQAEGEPDGRDQEHWARAKRLVMQARAKVEGPQVTEELGRRFSGATPPAPGLRNPEPMPATNAKGYVTIPTDEDIAPGAVSAGPAAPQTPPCPRSAR